MTRRTILTGVVIALVLLAGCSSFANDPAESTATNGTTAATGTPAPTAETTAAATTVSTATATVTATETATATATPTSTATPTETATPTPTETATPTDTTTATETDESAASAAGPETPLDAGSIASGHVEGLRAAGSFSITDSETIEGAGEGGGTNDRSGRADLEANTARLTSQPTDEATRHSYAEGATAYEKTEYESMEPQYEVSELGRPLAESLLTATEIQETVRAVDYERSGSVTRDGRELAVYVANGTDSLSTDVLFRGEDVSEFSSTLVVDPETGIVHTLKTERTTDKLSAGEPNTIVETLEFSDVGSTSVEQPGWVDDLK
ncbi:hypothetical protein MUK72_01055 [Halococcus dombrowskii]|uniref:Uncharacterized protein n=1 Tax=Halococcus dombrowskii TaxID=179637 RepID=A0AAV3SIX8_HALDO|nr:hypothetical protein [Halococcus dombrowskii]UOO95320.1 hypothetical protein MUK72_01055 [Halococcus dombrowskii]